MKFCYIKKFSGAYIQDPLFWDYLYLPTKFQNEIVRKCLASTAPATGQHLESRCTHRTWN